jgi:hypothetical protein
MGVRLRARNGQSANSSGSSAGRFTSALIERLGGSQMLVCRSRTGAPKQRSRDRAAIAVMSCPHMSRVDAGGTSRPNDAKRRRNSHRQRVTEAAILGISAAILIFGSHASAEARLQFPITVPESIRYVFDLPWCKMWQFRCGICEKSDNQVVCDFDPQNCSKSSNYLRCVNFNVPAKCQIWSDGCNTCSRQPRGISCTALGCQPYIPAFTCMKEN